MPRLPHHSPNYGGKREGAGRPRGSFNKTTQRVLAMVEASPVHPVEFLLQMMNNEELTAKERGAAAQCLLPYTAPRLASTEVNVTQETDGLSNEQLLQAISDGAKQLTQLGITSRPVIDGTVERINGNAGRPSADVVPIVDADDDDNDQASLFEDNDW